MAKQYIVKEQCYIEYYRAYMKSLKWPHGAFLQIEMIGKVIKKEKGPKNELHQD